MKGVSGVREVVKGLGEKEWGRRRIEEGGEEDEVDEVVEMEMEEEKEKEEVVV